MTDIEKTAKMLESYRATMKKVEVLRGQISSIEHLSKYMDEPRYFGDKLLKPKQGPRRDTLERMLVRLYNTAETLSQKLIFCETMINSVLPESAVPILYNYYIGGLTMEQVAFKVQYSRTHCWRLWRAGLEFIQKEWGDELERFYSTFEV